MSCVVCCTESQNIITTIPVVQTVEALCQRSCAAARTLHRCAVALAVLVFPFAEAAMIAADNGAPCPSHLRLRAAGPLRRGDLS